MKLRTIVEKSLSKLENKFYSNVIPVHSLTFVVIKPNFEVRAESLTAYFEIALTTPCETRNVYVDAKE